MKPWHNHRDIPPTNGPWIVWSNTASELPKITISQSQHDFAQQKGIVFTAITSKITKLATGFVKEQSHALPSELPRMTSPYVTAGICRFLAKADKDFFEEVFDRKKLDINNTYINSEFDSDERKEEYEDLVGINDENNVNVSQIT